MKEETIYFNGMSRVDYIPIVKKQQGYCSTCNDTGKVLRVNKKCERIALRCICKLGDPNLCLPEWVKRINGR